MAEQFLDRAKVRSGTEQMRGESVPQGMRCSAVIKTEGRAFEPERTLGNSRRQPFTSRPKEKRGVAGKICAARIARAIFEGVPVCTDPFPDDIEERDFAGFPALTENAQGLAGFGQITPVKRQGFADPQPRAV